MPRNYHEVQKFLGLVQYLAQFMPDITAYTTPLSGAAHNNRAFQWTPLLDKCFESIKELATRAPILKPVDFSRNEPVWVITDGFKTGVGAVVMYGGICSRSGGRSLLKLLNKYQLQRWSARYFR